MSNNQSCCPDPYGQFDDWIEIYNPGRYARDIGGLFLTDDPANPKAFRIPTNDPRATTIPGRGFLLLWADRDRDEDGIHLSFRLSSRGEHLRLYAADGTTLLDSVTFGPLRRDVAYGRLSPRGRWFFLDEPSPLEANIPPGKHHHSHPPTYSHPGGHYSHPITVSLAHPDPNTSFFLSTDGAIPQRDARPRITVHIKATTVVRALAVTEGLLPSDVVTQTYFIDDRPTLPAVSIALDPDHLWGGELGIYVKGNRNNFTRDWERPAHIEFYGADGGLEFSQDVGVQIHGGWSRNQPQKSLAIHAREKYGSEAIFYPLFPDKPVSRYSSFILRNSGNDWTYTLLRDAIAQALVRDPMEIDYQSYRPVVLYLNARYWGIHNMRERISVDYVTDNHGFGPDEVDYLFNNSEVRAGSSAHYHSLVKSLETGDLTDPGAPDRIRARMDVDEYLNYNMAQMYAANTDWPGNNLEFWRPRTADGRWRWIFYDTDYGFNLPLALNPSPPEFDMVAMATIPGKRWPNPPWATVLPHSLLQVDEFRHDFIQRFAAHLNTTFDWPRVDSVIVSMRDAIAPEIPRHAERWSPHPSPFYGDSFATMEEWDANLEVMRAFARVRSGHVWNHVQARFSLEGRSLLSLQVEPEGAGTLFVNTVSITDSRSSGYYFNRVPLELVAVPAPGFEFDSWSDSVSDAPRATLLIRGDHQLVARFTPSTQPPSELPRLPVVINEINYNSSETLDSGDWVELHNFGSASLSIAGWRLRDSGPPPHFALPPDVLLEGDGYVVLCRDSTAFSEVYPRIDGCIGNLPFGLGSRGDQITLSTDLGRTVDSIAYDERPPWPPEPNGAGFTLALSQPTLDNSNHEHWYASANGGTPGAPNVRGVPNVTPEVAASPRVVNFPNPFSTSTTVVVGLPAAANVSAHVFNLLGARVATLVENEIMEAGDHSLTWDGRLADGSEAAPGVYLCRIRINGTGMARKMLKVTGSPRPDPGG